MLYVQVPSAFRAAWGLQSHPSLLGKQIDVTGNSSAPHIGKLSVLLEWNAEDPPSAFEMHRNDVIYDTYQHNRNPFVDHPEWADSIW